MHGFKVGWYLDVGNEVRRLMWRLAHAHGGLLAIVNILYALVAGSQEPPAAERLAKASPLLIAAALLLPLGFFLGGSGLMAETRSSVFSWFRSGRSASLPTRHHGLRIAPERVTGQLLPSRRAWPQTATVKQIYPTARCMGRGCKEG